MIGWEKRPFNNAIRARVLYLNIECLSDWRIWLAEKAI